MPKIRLTKTELKKQKEELARYVQYLPTLQLKQQQLQAEVSKIHRNMVEEKAAIKGVSEAIDPWIAVFAEGAGIEKLVSVEKVLTVEGNVAGVDIPVFKEAVFKVEEYDPVWTPLWVDDGIVAVKNVLMRKAKIKVMEAQLVLIQEELRITTQRVNLFEKVKIPEKQENIRKIHIFLGDMDTAAVVTGKIAKDKIRKKEESRVMA